MPTARAGFASSCSCCILLEVSGLEWCCSCSDPFDLPAAPELQCGPARRARLSGTRWARCRVTSPTPSRSSPTTSARSRSSRQVCLLGVGCRSTARRIGSLHGGWHAQQAPTLPGTLVCHFPDAPALPPRRPPAQAFSSYLLIAWVSTNVIFVALVTMFSNTTWEVRAGSSALGV